MPEIDEGMIDGNVEPTASSGVAPSARDRGRGDHRATHAEHSREDAGQDTDEQRADELQHVRHKRSTL